MQNLLSPSEDSGVHQDPVTSMGMEGSMEWLQGDNEATDPATTTARRAHDSLHGYSLGGSRSLADSTGSLELLLQSSSAQKRVQPPASLQGEQRNCSSSLRPSSLTLSPESSRNRGVVMPKTSNNFRTIRFAEIISTDMEQGATTPTTAVSTPPVELLRFLERQQVAYSSTSSFILGMEEAQDPQKWSPSSNYNNGKSASLLGLSSSPSLLSMSDGGGYGSAGNAAGNSSQQMSMMESSLEDFKGFNDEEEDDDSDSARDDDDSLVGEEDNNDQNLRRRLLYAAGGAGALAILGWGLQKLFELFGRRVNEDDDREVGGDVLGDVADIGDPQTISDTAQALLINNGDGGGSMMLSSLNHSVASSAAGQLSQSSISQSQVGAGLYMGGGTEQAALANPALQR
jgi:hypothetical protein